MAEVRSQVPRRTAAAAAGSDSLAAARVRFLAGESVGPELVGEPILWSWRRSRGWNVAADRIELPYVDNPETDTPVVRSASSILERLRDELREDAVSVILTDAKGMVLERHTGDDDLARHLDRVQLAPGFSYAERYVGTNGIGTALEQRQPAGVLGHEHYAEHLEDLACAGVPIRHPVSGTLLGVLDLTCWRREASSLLMALAKTTAARIEGELTSHVGMRELALFRAYRRACHRSGGIVFAIGEDTVMMSEQARQFLPHEDQAVILGRAAEATTLREAMLTVNLPSGDTARLSCTPVLCPSGCAGLVVRVRIREGVPSPEARRHPTRSFLAGVVGSGPLWQRACEQVETHLREREWTIVQGETGVGKLAVLRALHQLHRPGAPFKVVDLAEPPAAGGFPPLLRDAFDRREATVVLRHLDQLPERRRHELAAAMRQVCWKRERADLPWVAVTRAGSATDDELDALLAAFRAPSRCRRCATTSTTSATWRRSCSSDSPTARG